MFWRTASKKPSRLLSDQLIAFKFAVKLLDNLGVEFRMKSGRHGTPIGGHHHTFFRSGLPRQIGADLDYAATSRLAETTLASIKGTGASIEATGQVSIGSGSICSATAGGEKPVSALFAALRVFLAFLG